VTVPHSPHSAFSFSPADNPVRPLFYRIRARHASVWAEGHPKAARSGRLGGLGRDATASEGSIGALGACRAGRGLSTGGDGASRSAPVGRLG